MCGIAGEINFKGSIDTACVEKMADAMKHRGPDDSGEFISDSRYCTMAHRRLSVIDLSQKGRQPMTTDDGTFSIVFNGEIYNYRELRKELESVYNEDFYSTSDTEVLLKLWQRQGACCIDKLRGMFVFCIWNENDKTLTLVRDPFGIKSLYYKQDSNGLVFASEIKAFQAAGLVSGTDMKGVGLFLRWGSIPSPKTIYQGIKSLEPGTWMTFSEKHIETENYWNYQQTIARVYDYPEDIVENYSEAVSLVRETLLDSVKAHLVSDVPVGAFLSGGIDSTAVVSFMRQAGQEHIATFSITSDSPELDESYYAGIASRTYRTEHHEWKVNKNDFLFYKSQFLSSMDQPTIDGMNVFMVSRLARENGYKVVTSGIGGDEFFAGYTDTFQRLPKLVKMLSMVPSSVLKAEGKLLDGLTTSGLISQRWQKFGQMFSGELSLTRAYDNWRGLFSSNDIRALFFDRDLGSEVANVKSEDFLPDVFSGLNTREKISVFEVSRYLGSQLLPDEDVFSMAHSLELRTPLVDRMVAEKLARIKYDHPEKYPKQLLVEAVGDIPPQIVNRKKMGFAMPMDKWLKKEKWTPKSEILDPAFCRKVENRFRKGKLHWSRRWALEIVDRFLNQ